MILSIRDIPHEGQNFEFNEDGIYVKGFVYPLKGGFDISGEFDAHLETECSFCAEPMKIPVHEKFHELMMLQGKIARQLKEVEINHNDLEIHYVDGNEIDLGPIIHEMIDVNMPIQPNSTEEVTKDGRPKCIEGTAYEKYMAENAESPIKSPFDVLKNLKKN